MGTTSVVTQPLSEVAASSALNVPDVGYIKRGDWVVLSVVPSLVKSQAHPVMLPADMLLVLLNTDGKFKHTLGAVKFTTGNGSTWIGMVTLLVQLLLVVTVKLTLVLPTFGKMFPGFWVLLSITASPLKSQAHAFTVFAPGAAATVLVLVNGVLVPKQSE